MTKIDILVWYSSSNFMFRRGNIMEYEINKGTLAIVPNEIDESLVYEDEERFLIHQSPFQIMEDSCKYFGSTYEGGKIVQNLF